MTFYKLSLTLSKDNNNFLWLAILGLTDLFIQNKISYQMYIEVIQIFSIKNN